MIGRFGMLVFGWTDVERFIDAGTLERGQALHANGQVIDVDINDGGTVIVGRVRGSEQRPYQQMISLRPGNNGVIIHGTCSCPMRTNCKHVAAVLIEVERKNDTVGSERANALSGASGNVPRSQGLSPQLKLWLDELAEAAQPVSGGNAYPTGIKQRLIYVLAVEPGRNGFPARGEIRPVVASLLKSGAFGSTKSYSPSNINNYQPAKHLRPIDHEILKELDWLERRTGSYSIGGIKISADPMFTRVLRSILVTGRCRWREVSGPVLSEGPVRRARLAWRIERGARQSLVIEPGSDTADDGAAALKIDAVLASSPPYYIDLGAGVAGPLDLGLPDAVAARVAAMPAVTAGEALTFTAALTSRLTASGLEDRIPLPMPPPNTLMRPIAPKPRLELLVATFRIKSQYAWYVREQRHRGSFPLPVARLSFDYDGQIMSADASGRTVERMEGDTLIVSTRDRSAEAAAIERLQTLGLRSVTDSPLDAGREHSKDLVIAPAGTQSLNDILAKIDDPSLGIAFSTESVPQLIAEGWQVTFSDDYPYRIAEGEVGWWAGIGEGSGVDWFSFELGIEFEGQRINLAPQLANLLSKLPAEIGELTLSAEPTAARDLDKRCRSLRLRHTLPDGRLLFLPGERLAPILKGLFELVGPRADAIEGGKVKLHRAEAATLATLADGFGSDVAWAASAERLIALGRDLKRGRALKDIAPPAAFRAELRPYQMSGLSWLDFLRETGFGGVLADDMGLGKTVQALAFIAREKAEGRLDKPALIVAPTSVLPNWQAETERFAPSLDLLALRGHDRHERFGGISRHDLVLTTYPLLMRDHGVLLDHEFHLAILDEAQAIKNPRAAVAGLAHRIKARHRLALTGTPLENNLGEVWSLFEFLSPGLLGDEATFRRTFRTPIEKHGDKAAQAFLTRRLKPFMLRRTKQEVAKELPPKTEIVERVRLEGAQRDLYETVRVLMHEKVRHEIARKGLAKSHIVFLDALLKLRQICCDPRLLKMAEAKKVKQSAKLERLMEMIPEMVAEERRILVFSQFTSMLELIESELEARKIPFVKLTGDTVDRTKPVKSFQSGEVPVFLLSLKAGGTGLNLTAADTVIHYDPWWNPAVENQATDRAYRIGQTKPVFVYKLMVEEGIEEAIEILKERKAALAAALFEGASKSGLDLTEADISALFAPLGRRQARRAA